MHNASRLRRKVVACVMLTFSLAATIVMDAGPASAVSAPYGSCGAYQVIAVRGTGEPAPIGGVLQPLTDQITSRTARTVLTYGLPYPATSDWGASVNNGITQLADRLAISAAYCPSQRFVLVGYSQGAWVVGDALAGSGGGAAAKISPALGSKVAAVVLYGDPRFRAGELYDTGTFRAGVNGVIPRDKGALSAYASRIRSYCYGDDTVCQNGASGSGHSRYWQTATADAVNFAVSKIG